MAGMFEAQIIGHLGRDPETRYTPSGVMNVQFTVAHTEKWTDQNGSPQERTTWVRVTGWRKTAEMLDNLTQNGWLHKGRQVYCRGALVAREYQDQHNVTRTSLDMTLDKFVMLGKSEGGGDDSPDDHSGTTRTPPATGGKRDAPGYGGDQYAGGNFDDVPF